MPITYPLKIFITCFIIFNTLLFIKGLYESYKKKNAYGECLYLMPLGIFVWGDATVISLFWIGLSTATLIANNWYLFPFAYCLFFVVRGFGETVYWLNQQFSKVVRYKPEDHFPFKYFHNDSVYFIYQIIAQSATVIAIVASVYFGHLWLLSIS